jgi:hypothetical protein
MRSRIHLCTIAGVLAFAGTARADLTLNFFGDVNYVVEHEGETSNTFQAAALDIFASQTEGKFSFIGEILIEAFGDNSFDQDIDRLEVAYKPTDWLRFRAGRLRSAFGYYGDAYQNGKYFMTPVTWPEMYEGDGFEGILPSHSIGLHGDLSYALGGERGKITVDAEVLNGRGNGLDDVPVFEDGNNSKAINLRLRYVGEGRLEGLVVGGNLYIDDIPTGTQEDEPDAELDHPAMHELVIGGHAAYVTDRYHAIAEAAWFRHREHGQTMTIETLAVFGEVGYKFEDVTPYTRFEYVHFDEAEDPYFVASGVPVETVRLWSVGVRYAASASVALKLEGAADLWDGHGHALAQAAFAF